VKLAQCEALASVMRGARTYDGATDRRRDCGAARGEVKPDCQTEIGFPVVPDSYKIAFAALDAVWHKYPCESLAILLGGMAINRCDETPMDSGSEHDWKEVANQTKSSNIVDLILACLELDASRYEDVPDDLRNLIAVLRKRGTLEREMVDDVVATWHLDPESWPLYADLTPPK
jgi:hypothetical protein